MALRPKLGPGSGVIPGTTFFEEYEAAMKGLFDASAFPLTNIGGSPNDVTADLYWDLDAGLIDGMKFTLTWAASNGGPMTLSINGGPTVPILDAGGNVLTAGIASAGKRSFIEFIGGAFRILSGGGDGGDGDPRYWVFTASGTWEKPPLPDNHMILIEAWGGGGAGSTNAAGGGGGGGGYKARWFRAEELPSIISVSIGAGGNRGSAGAKGGNTTLGSLLTAYGGGGGGSNGGGGGGGGALGAGGSGSGSSGGNGGAPDGARGSSGGASPEPTGAPGLWGGGGGDGAAGARDGSWAIFGGGGGVRASAGGQSVFGGDGGGGGQPGEAPAGGGGRNADGARGEVRIWA